MAKKSQLVKELDAETILRDPEKAGHGWDSINNLQFYSLLSFKYP